MSLSRVISDIPPAPVDYLGPVVVVVLVVAAVVAVLVMLARRRGRH
ncbi:MAG: hypothetical protein KBB39_09485 [Phycicoccus sp.]|nr:hypothetical protein [Phycicoccus sp.]